MKNNIADSVAIIENEIQILKNIAFNSNDPQLADIIAQLEKAVLKLYEI